jgi:enoyl-[acyl-carrier protein] reductase II
MWKVIPGVLTQWDKMYQLALFGAATEKLMAATIEGNLNTGVQFVGQSQGLIHDIPTVEQLVLRCVQEAEAHHSAIGKKFSS